LSNQSPDPAPEIRLTTTSYIVLGFISLLGEATPYDLKRMVAISVGHFWSFPHSQLYAEPQRLAEAGHLTVRQEQGGRRRKLYELSPTGRAALEQWRAAPVEGSSEIRDPATLKLFFGAEPRRLAQGEREKVLAELAELERIREENRAALRLGPQLALDYGTHMLRASLSFWERVLARSAR
jgi:DNA-binding PadR family transcriptional regulator